MYMLSPLPRRSGWAYLSLIHPAVSAFPERVTGSACASSFSRLARRSLALRPAHSRCHRISWLAIRRLQPLRYLHSCSGCFRLERSPGGICTHWKAPPFHGARHKQTHASQQTTSVAVGTRVSSRAPRTEPYVRLSRIRLPPRVSDGKAITRPRVENNRFWKPIIHQLRHPRPRHPILLTATS